MEELRKRTGCVAITSGIATILLLLVLLVIRAVFLKEFDIFNTSQIDLRICLITFPPLAFGVLWLFYKSAFIQETYTDEEKRVILQQLWALVAFIVVSFFSLMTILSSLADLALINHLILSGLLAYVGLSAMKNRVSLITFRGASNKGWAAFVIGLIITVAAGAFFISRIKFIFGQ
jgi:hypothetical protein